MPRRAGRQWWYGLFSGIEDLTKGVDNHETRARRKWIYWTIDHAPFQKWVVFVAGIGFLTDAYDIFALNGVMPILGHAYWKGDVPRNIKTAMLCATLAGTLMGQVVFGVLADIFGRRKMYGLELVVVIAATLGVAMSAEGQKGSMHIEGWLIFWRLAMGFGIGADYPVSAVITSEFAPRKHRARMLAWVFLMQPVGQLLGILVSLVVIRVSRQSLNVDSTYCNTDACLRAADSAWRWVIGLGAIPSLVAVTFRLTIPESPRYMIDVAGAIKTAHIDTRAFYGNEDENVTQSFMMEEILQATGLIPNGVPNGLAQNMAHQRLEPPTRSAGESLSPTALSRTSSRVRIAEESQGDPNLDTNSPREIDATHESQTPSNNDDESIIDNRHDSLDRTDTRSSVEPSSNRGPVPEQTQEPDFPRASREDAHKYFAVERNWRHLVGTTVTWFLLDFAFYGLGLSTPTITKNIWQIADKHTQENVYTSLLNNCTHSLVLFSIGTMVGSAVYIKAIKHWSPKAIQFYGFIVLAALMIIVGSAFSKLLGTDYQSVIIVLYVLCQLAFNLGPNTTTFTIPAEIFPTRYRCTCHGISAAAGKLGSIVAQVFFAYAHFGGRAYDDDDPKSTWLGSVLMVLSAFMIAGAVITKWLVPETRDARGNSRSLEVLAQGRERLTQLGKDTAPEDGQD